MKRLAALFLLIFPLSLNAQYYDYYYDRAMDIDLSDFSGTGYGSTQEEATENAFMDLSMMLGVQVWSSTTVSYIGGKKTVNTSTSVTSKLSVPRGMVQTEVHQLSRKRYCVYAELKVKEYILDCERRMADCEKYTYQAQEKYDGDRWASLAYSMLGYWRSILDTPIYWSFDPKKTKERLESIDSQMRGFRLYYKNLVPGVILDESLEIVQ